LWKFFDGTVRKLNLDIRHEEGPPLAPTMCNADQI
jgi:hypothetical protein